MLLLLIIIVVVVAVAAVMVVILVVMVVCLPEERVGGAVPFAVHCRGNQESLVLLLKRLGGRKQVCLVHLLLSIVVGRQDLVLRSCRGGRKQGGLLLLLVLGQRCSRGKIDVKQRFWVVRLAGRAR